MVNCLKLRYALIYVVNFAVVCCFFFPVLSQTSETGNKKEKNPGVIFIFSGEHYKGSSFGAVDYTVITDFFKDPGDIIDYPFSNYAPNYTSGLPSQYGFELFRGSDPGFLRLNSNQIYPELRNRIGLYFNLGTQFGHVEDSVVSPDTLISSYLEYKHIAHLLSYSADMVYFIRLTNWINIYSGFGVLAGISLKSKIEETRGSYFQLSSSQVHNNQISSEKRTFKGNPMFRFGFYIPAGIRVNIHHRFSLRAEYQWGQLKQSVFNGGAFTKIINNFGFGIEFHLQG